MIYGNCIFNTIHKVNKGNYTKEQIKAWAPSDFDKSIWKNKIMNIQPYVAVINSKIVAYADIQCNGLIDHFFSDYEFQRMGVGRKLYSFIET